MRSGVRVWAVRGVRDASQCVPQLLDGEDDRLRLDELGLRREPRREGEQAVEPLGERARGARRVDAPPHKLERLQVVSSSRGLELVELPEATVAGGVGVGRSERGGGRMRS